MPKRLRHLHLEPIGGLAGDMLLAALLDLGAEVGAIQAHFDRAGTAGLRLEWMDVTRHGVPARYVRSIAPTVEHHHAHLTDVVAVLEAMQLPQGAAALARRAFEVLAGAEAEAHGTSVGEVHLHEVGALDSIMDVAGVALALDQLGHPTVSSAVLPSGQGHVETSHGRLSCPVPAVKIIAQTHQIELQLADIVGETVTPTGIALLAALRSAAVPPSVSPAAIGVGAGSRDFANRPNIVRVLAW